MSKYFVTSLTTLFATSLALGELQINQWNPKITTGYTINEPERRIFITTGHPTEVFKFEAYDNVTNLPETINEITVETGAGTVLLAVIGDPAGERTLGAADLEKLDLSGASSSTLVQVKIDTDLGVEGPTVADSLAADGGPTGDPDMQYGGICFAGATSCDVTVTGRVAHPNGVGARFFHAQRSGFGDVRRRLLSDATQ